MVKGTIMSMVIKSTNQKPGKMGEVMTKSGDLISPETIGARILFILGERVLLSSHLAELYEVETRVLNQAVKRNLDRFPEDFMFQLSEEDVAMLVSQNVIPHKKHFGGSLPYAFTEQGVAMLSSVLNSKRAVMVNIGIMRAFVKLRRMLASNAELAQKLDTLEKKYDDQFKVVFEAIRQLMTPPETKKRPIGFGRE
jgi:hypothetical protein